MDEFQEADILWPDTEDELVVPSAPMDTEEPYQAAGSVSNVALAPVFGRGLFFSGAGPSLSAGASHDADDDEEEWQEADVLWPDTAADEPRGSSAGGLMWPFSGSSGGGSRAGLRRVKPAGAAMRDGWTTTGPAASSPINIPGNVAPRRRFRTAMNRRRS